MKKHLLIILLIFMVSGISLYSDINFKGLIQSWFSYSNQGEDDNNTFGFTIRRVRFNPYGTFTKNIKWGLQLSWDKQSAALLDAYLDFHLSANFNIKIGQFAAPGAKSGVLTSSGHLDMVERSAITQVWNTNNNLFGYRAIGLQAYGEFANKKVYYALMLANNSTTSIFNPSVKSSTYSHEDNGLTIWGRVEAKIMEGMAAGLFYGEGKISNTSYVKNSYGAHLYYQKNALNFKAEYISGKFGIEGSETQYSGGYISIGYKVDKIEPIVRYGFYSPNDGNSDSKGVEKYDNITAGINYFYNKNIKFQVNYIHRMEIMEGDNSLNNDLFYINIQYIFP